MARTLLLALTVCIATAAHADDPSLQGTFLNEQQSAQPIETAIETAVAKMNFIKRPIARSRLKKTNEAHRRVEIGFGSGQISVAFDGRKPVQMPADGSTIRELLGLPTSSARNQSLAEATLEPGASTRRHYHRESEELYYLVEGSGEIEVDGERAGVAPGDAILIPPGAWHRIEASPDAALRFLCCCAPPYRHEDTYFE